VITLLQNQPDDTGQYFYLLPGNETDPYDLKPIIENPKEEKQNSKEKGDFESFDRKKFYTISKKGITTYE